MINVDHFLQMNAMMITVKDVYCNYMIEFA